MPEPAVPRVPRSASLLQVDDEDGVGQPLHVGDAAEVGLELLELALAWCIRSFVGSSSSWPSSFWRRSSWRRAIRLEIVRQLVSRPPSQRWVT